MGFNSGFKGLNFSGSFEVWVQFGIFRCINFTLSSPSDIFAVFQRLLNPTTNPSTLTSFSNLPHNVYPTSALSYTVQSCENEIFRYISPNDLQFRIFSFLEMSNSSSRYSHPLCVYHETFSANRLPRNLTSYLHRISLRFCSISQSQLNTLRTGDADLRF